MRAMFEKFLQGMPNQGAMQLIFGGRSGTRRPTAAIPNYTPDAPPKKSSPPPPPPPPPQGTKKEYTPEQKEPQAPPADIKPMVNIQV
jgi:hypothetical protein